MNRSKIEGCDHTWNPITGCRHDCRYCYARRMTARFAGDVRLNLMAKKDYLLAPAADGGEDLYVLDTPMMNETGNPLVYPFGFAPTFHRYRMNTLDKLKMGNNIFVGAMADVFGAWVPDEWIKEILDVCVAHPIHNFFFLTKNPERYWELEEKGMLPAGKNMWYGYSYTCNKSRGWASMNGDKNNFVSVEPLLEDLALFDENVLCPAAKWVIIGAETGRNKNKVVPKIEWVNKILLHCEKFKIPVFMKDSLIPIVGEENMRKDFPEQLRHSEISPKMKKKLFDVCADCKAHLKKSDMITLLARSKRGEHPKKFGFMCKDCFKKFCGGLGLDIPKLAELEESIEEREG